MTVKTITLTLDARYDAEGIARDLQAAHPEILAFEVRGPFDVKEVKSSSLRFYLRTLELGE